MLPSRAFQGNDWSEHANVKRLIDALFGEYEIWYKEEASGKRIVGPDKIRQHLTHFVLEAYRTWRAWPVLTMGVHLGKDHYGKGGDRQRPKHLTYSAVKHVTDFLVARHYLERPEGLATWHPDPRLRRTTRFRATRGLVDLCHEYSVNRYMIRALPDSRGHHPEEEEKARSVAR